MSHDKAEFIFYPSMFKDNIDEFKKAFSERFGTKYRIGYSVKTNRDEYVLDEVLKNGLMAEIVSKDEYNLVKKIGFTDDNIIYNGVMPDVFNKYHVALAGGIVNIENLFEFKQIAERAAENKTKISLGVRINLNFSDYQSRFGFVFCDDEYKEMKHIVESNEYVSINCVHCHVHGGRQTKYFARRTKYMSTVAKDLSAQYIDLGGNLYGNVDDGLRRQFDEDLPTAKDYADTISTALSEVYPDDAPAIIIETGTALIGNAVDMVCRVTSVRKRENKYIATCNGSSYDFGFFKGSVKKVPMDILHMSEGVHVDAIEIFGYACTEDDVVNNSYTGNIAEGDILIFKNLGAYAQSLSGNFICNALRISIKNVIGNIH